MRIPCSCCGKPATVTARPKKLENMSQTDNGAESLGRVYLVCNSCGATGYADWLTRMTFPKPVKAPNYFA